MLEFLVGYLFGSAASAPSRPMSDGEAWAFGAFFVLLLVVGVPALVRSMKRGL